MVSLHIHLPTSDRQYLETKDFWGTALHGTTQDGRDVDLGHLRKSLHRRLDPSSPFYHCSADDECSLEVPFGGTGGLHLQSCVSTSITIESLHMLITS
jgi:hypothetical protein